MLHRHPAAGDLPATIWICHDCGIEHHGRGAALPLGWDLSAAPGSHLDHVRCPDCLESIERDFITAHHAESAARCPWIFGPGAQLGIGIHGNAGRLEARP